jgi:hypothetical protein
MLNIGYGGINGESKQYLDSWALFDLETMTWQSPIVQYSDSENKLGRLAMHTMSK